MLALQSRLVLSVQVPRLWLHTPSVLPTPPSRWTPHRRSASGGSKVQPFLPLVPSLQLSPRVQGFTVGATRKDLDPVCLPLASCPHCCISAGVGEVSAAELDAGSSRLLWWPGAGGLMVAGEGSGEKVTDECWRDRFSWDLLTTRELREVEFLNGTVQNVCFLASNQNQNQTLLPPLGFFPSPAPQWPSQHTHTSILRLEISSHNLKPPALGNPAKWRSVLDSLGEGCSCRKPLKGSGPRPFSFTLRRAPAAGV